jgi:uncharacterized membrane protein
MASTDNTPPEDGIGPVDCMIVRFPGNRFTGEIAPALGALVDSGTIRIIDLVFVKKDEDGSVTAVELSELDPDEAAPYDEIEGETEGLLSEEDLDWAAESIEPNSSALLLVWENTWATRVAEAIRGAGGQLVMFERIPHDEVVVAMQSVSDTEQG